MARALVTSSPTDLIVSPATASGVGAIAVVRLSGTGTRDCVRRVFSAELSAAPPGQLTLGHLLHPLTGERIDQCFGVRFAAPRSYTGEDMVEFQLHGSPVIIQATLDACVAAGARLAEPGEFTRRAFLNGKMDLSQAEAVADLTRAQTEQARRAALNQLGGGLARELAEVRTELIRVTAELEAGIDFPEEGIPAPQLDHLLHRIQLSIQGLTALADTYARGRRMVQGARVVLAGPPNAGKSSLFNAILGKERAIVSPHPGTTRDSIEAVIDLDGIPVTLVDTAGLRTSAEEIEAEGIRRTRQEIESADLILFIIDYKQRNVAFDEYGPIKGLDHLVVFNKAEHLVGVLIGGVSGFDAGPPGRHGIHFISAKERKGLEKLEDAILRHLRGVHSDSGSESVITSARHEAALRSAIAALEAAAAGLREGRAAELIVVDLATALSEIDAISGKGELDEDILDVIFSSFCLGK